jgi:hypothetical protein
MTFVLRLEEMPLCLEPLLTAGLLTALNINLVSMWYFLPANTYTVFCPNERRYSSPISSLSFYQFIIFLPISGDDSQQDACPSVFNMHDHIFYDKGTRRFLSRLKK